MAEVLAQDRTVLVSSQFINELSFIDTENRLKTGKNGGGKVFVDRKFDCRLQYGGKLTDMCRVFNKWCTRTLNLYYL